MEILNEISLCLQSGDSKCVSELTKRAVKEEISPEEILNDSLIPGMNVIGKKYKAHEIFLPDVLLAAKAMYSGIDILKPLLLESEIKILGKVVIGTVQGDLHDIGKNLVGIMLKGSGFEVIDLGNNVSPEMFVETAEKEKAEIIGMSALLTTTMAVMKDVIEELKKKDLKGSIKTIVGGAPVSPEYAEAIGADAYGYDSYHAVEMVKELLKEVT